MGEEINNKAADPMIHLSIERTELALNARIWAGYGPALMRNQKKKF